MKQQFVVNVPSFRPNVGGQGKALSDQDIRDTLEQAIGEFGKKIDGMSTSLTKFAEREEKLRADIADLQARQSKAVANQAQADFYDTLPD